MRLPEVSDPQRYRGLYAFDFGEWCAVGYTAEEVAMLLESRQYANGKVFRIRRAWPDGRMELQGVSSSRFNLESGMFFVRRDEEAARADFAELRESADRAPPPCRASLQLAARADEFVTALLYPAEFDGDVADWLLRVGYAGGDTAEGGVSHVDDFHRQRCRIIARAQLTGAPTLAARPADEVMRSVRRAVQR